MPDTELGRALLYTARQTLDRAFGDERVAAGNHPRLDAPGATFVTLTRQGELRGCVGTLEARRPLQKDVEQNTLAAAFHDPRFAPLADDEFADTRIEVSLLSAPLPLSFTGEDDLLHRLNPGIDGVVLEWRGRRATFLPQVWETLPEPRQFLAALKHKAGIAPDFWDDRIRISRYTVDKWKESDTQHE